MNNTPGLDLFLKIVLLAGCFVLVAAGTRLVFLWGETPHTAIPNVTKDSTRVQNQTVDSAKMLRITTTETVISKAGPAYPYTANYNTLKEEMMKKGYDLIFLGLVLLVVLLVLPSLSELSLFQLFSAKFRDKVETGKAIINEAANATNTNLPSQKPATTEKQVTQAQLDALQEAMPVERRRIESITRYADDPQKGRWGGSDINSNRKLSASVFPLTENKELFKVVLKVTSTAAEKPLTGKVAFHLHPTFPNPDPLIYVLQGEAKLELIAWGAFTVGAEADAGTTTLELDLAALPEAPLLFKSR